MGARRESERASHSRLWTFGRLLSESQSSGKRESQSEALWPVSVIISLLLLLLWREGRPLRTCRRRSSLSSLSPLSINGRALVNEQNRRAARTGSGGRLMAGLRPAQLRPSARPLCHLLRAFGALVALRLRSSKLQVLRDSRKTCSAALSFFCLQVITDATTRRATFACSRERFYFKKRNVVERAHGLMAGSRDNGARESEARNCALWPSARAQKTTRAPQLAYSVKSLSRAKTIAELPKVSI